MTIRILVTGSRDWTDRVVISRKVFAFINEHCPYLLDENGFPIRRDWSDVVIVHGDCPTGADALAEEFAQGCDPPIKTEKHPADWSNRRLRKRAGIIRNKKMVRLGADVCFAFVNMCRSDSCDYLEIHGSHGASNCSFLAQQAGIETDVTLSRDLQEVLSST